MQRMLPAIVTYIRFDSALLPIAERTHNQAHLSTYET
jgi:hypothetical protein